MGARPRGAADPWPCANCPLDRRGFRDVWRTAAGRMERCLETRYAWLPAADREDILGQTTEQAIRGICDFRGDRPGKFAAWAWRIFRNRLHDHFRSRSPDAEALSDAHPATDDARDTAELRMALLRCFHRHLPLDADGCVALYLDFYRRFRTGDDQKKLADARGLKPNALNQRLRRCRPFIRRLFRACRAE
ncbi:MAG: type III-E CRISPR-associated RpoE-like sigma factor [Desulfococcaceae bacterium]